MAWADQPPPQTTEVRRVNLAAENFSMPSRLRRGGACGYARRRRWRWRRGKVRRGWAPGEGGHRPRWSAERRARPSAGRDPRLDAGRAQAELPPGDLPALLADGELLMSLADTAMPGVGAPYVGSLPSRKFEAFATACRQLGVPESEILQESWLVGPQRSAELVVRGVEALAREASARRLLPPLSS